MMFYFFLDECQFHYLNKSFGCTFISSAHLLIKMAEAHYQAHLAKLDEDEKGSCDVKISVSGVLFDAHRKVLGTSCGYFDTLFASRFKDNKDIII